jgi:glycolate dehydrogenase FAD-binding subunit
VIDADAQALRAAAGEDALAAHEPRDVDGAKLAWTLTPPDGAALARAVAVLAERGLGAVVAGGGSGLGLGNPPRDPAVILSTSAIAGVDEMDADEGVARVSAGTPLAALRDAAEAAGWEAPLDPPGAHVTLGGALATAALGPRHLGLGRARDWVLGLEVVLGDGSRTRCGGRVVKNVTGYDLMKLHLGALGTLGVIERAWLRMRARPEAERVLAAAVGEGEAAVARGVEAARLPSARAAALVEASLAGTIEPTASPERGFVLVVELAGPSEVVERDARALAAQSGAADASRGALARLRNLQGGIFGPVGLLFRVSALPSRLPAALAALARGGGAALVYPGSGLVYAHFTLDLEGDGAGVEAAWRTARAAARQGGGHALLERAPTWAKQGGDVFGDPPEGMALMRALKQRFDPAGILNPGRFAGGL